jgi:hypothetical protein
MAINQLSTANTFQQWLGATQALISNYNFLEANIANVAIANTNIQAANAYIQAANVAAISNIQTAQAVAFANVNVEQSDAFANVTTAKSDALANVATIQSTAYANVFTTQSNAFANVTSAQSNAFANVVTIQSTAYANVNTIYQSAVTLSILVQSKSNTTNVTAQTVFDYTSTAFNTANNSNTVANQALVTSQLAYDTSNLAVSNLTFQATLVQAYNTANGAFDKANSANVLAQNSYNFANTVNTYSQSAFAFANTINTYSQSAFAFANTVNTYSQAAFAKANTNANTDFTGIVVTAGTYGGTTVVPIITLSANGRIAAIANVDISGVGGTTVVLTNDITSDATRYVTFTTATSGNVSTLNVSSSSLTFNPYTGTLSATVFSSLSDENLKSNIIHIKNAQEVVNQLEGVTFDWKDGSGSSYGLIAQEVEKILPHAVHMGADYKTVNYSAVIPFLIETIKDLNRRITDLENKQ